MEKLKVAILVGGPSTEYEVSLNSGKNVLKKIDVKKFSPSLVVLSRKLKLSVNNQPAKFPEDLKKFDVIFNAMHGQFGEDGQIQAILENLSIPFTGSDLTASNLAMDKWTSLKIFKKSGLRAASNQLLRKPNDKIKPRLKFPIVLKPRYGGSSVGISIVKDKKDLAKKVKIAFKHDSGVVVEEYIPGKEFACSVLEVNGRPKALPVIEIRPKSKYEFFNYEAKYKTDATEEIVPAPISGKLTMEIQRASLIAHKALGCQTYSRSDFIWCKNKLYILELNTLPGLTQTSLFPKSAKAAGLSLKNLITTIINSSLSSSPTINKSLKT
ncbi:MAG: D-alanine--D-alanine ligase [Patescibacteria group bacterium]